MKVIVAIAVGLMCSAEVSAYTIWVPETSCGIVGPCRRPPLPCGVVTRSVLPEPGPCGEREPSCDVPTVSRPQFGCRHECEDHGAILIPCWWKVPPLVPRSIL
jgi:hypothetical protein